MLGDNLKHSPLDLTTIGDEGTLVVIDSPSDGTPYSQHSRYVGLAFASSSTPGAVSVPNGPSMGYRLYNDNGFQVDGWADSERQTILGRFVEPDEPTEDTRRVWALSYQPGRDGQSVHTVMTHRFTEGGYRAWAASTFGGAMDAPLATLAAMALKGGWITAEIH